MNVMAQNRALINDRWINRPADETFSSLNALHHHTRELADNSFATVHDVKGIEVITDQTLSSAASLTALGLKMPSTGEVVQTTHWSFGQMCSLIGCPAGHYRDLPAPIGAHGIQYKLNTYQGELVKAYTDERTGSLRALTSPTYGRVEDFKLVHAVQQIAGNGIGDTSWQAAQLLKGMHPAAFYASDRDLYIFLVDVEHPIEMRNPTNGRSETLYRGVIIWNSEVGSRSLGIKTFLFRSYCDNRLIFGTDQLESIIIRHTKGAPEKFLEVAGPALLTYANAGTDSLVRGIQSAMTTTLAGNDDEAIKYLNDNTAFSLSAARSAIKQHAVEEGHPARSAWDLAQAVTAYARSIPHQDDRITMERQATKLLGR
jgi:hypothetical protein